MTEIWMLEHDLCRCCHVEGTFQNLALSNSEVEGNTTYVDMLRDCLDINIVPVPGMLCNVTYTICGPCITRLTDVAKFRAQVEACEKKFKDFYNRDAIKIEDELGDIIIKEELPDDYEDDEPDEDNTEPEESVQKKIKKDSKPKKEKSKASKKISRPKKLEDNIKEVENKRKNVPTTKFCLRDDDFTQEGDILSCARCDKKYDKKSSLCFHVKTKHYKIPRYSCPYCKKQFMTPAPLTVHKLEAHNVDERFNCNACKGIFNTKVQLRKHINNFHMLGEKYKCEFCEYESFSFESMYKHKFKHKTVKDYQCRFCKKAFVRKTTLDLHERIHTGDRRKVCPVCSQAFVQKASLNYHMTKYHPEVKF
ncbi:uncharacterized protein LOC142985194 isoform X2 [Anticarsia gemmatalis]|uniref:uncharacterized protein LOC142985194 isoform X2 n=1 Tax=Anticarsia gemmatalis TaxID=129554 RepID=UPI003F778072